MQGSQRDLIPIIQWKRPRPTEVSHLLKVTGGLGTAQWQSMFRMDSTPQHSWGGGEWGGTLRSLPVSEKKGPS